MTLHPDQPIAGILAPLFALRSAHDLGIGDTAALRELIDWAAEAGFGLIQLLPINETGRDNSPYNAISSVAIEPTTLTLQPYEPAELAQGDFEEVLADFDLAALRTGAVVYPEVKRLKRALLERAWAVFRSGAPSGRRARAFRAFRQEHAAWIEAYATFRVMMEENGGTEQWDEFPEEQRTCAAATAWIAAQKRPARRVLEERRSFFAYVQWIAYTQWREVHDYASARGVALMGDVPFGVSYYSSDVFAQPEIFDGAWSGGAPPEKVFKSDPFTEKWGQNWGIPNYEWETMRGENFAWWRQRVRMVREIFHLFRIDHILGFYRIYSFPWRPQENATFLPLTEDEARARTDGRLPGFRLHDDSTAENRAANCRQGEELLRVLLEETGEHRLIGEDLGVVPDYVRPNLTSLGIAGFKVPQWENDGHGQLLDGRGYQRLSVIAYATHDHQPIATFWNEWIRAIAEGGEAGDRARHDLEAFAKFASLPEGYVRPFDDGIREGLLAALFGSNSWLAIGMITDLFGSEQRFNVPGAVAESNWSARLETSAQGWAESPEMAAKIGRLRDMLLAAHRIPLAKTSP